MLCLNSLEAVCERERTDDVKKKRNEFSKSKILLCDALSCVFVCMCVFVCTWDVSLWLCLSFCACFSVHAYACKCSLDSVCVSVCVHAYMRGCGKCSHWGDLVAAGEN